MLKGKGSNNCMIRKLNPVHTSTRGVYMPPLLGNFEKSGSNFSQRCKLDKNLCIQLVRKTSGTYV